MAKKMEELRWNPMWVSHLGCVKGCLDYLGLDVTDQWLFGGTGHAFVINMHEAVCPSGPTAWNTEMIFQLGKNIGYEVDGVYAMKTDEDFKEKQKKAWEHARRSIDSDFPCFGWELEIPEYYVVYGYDDTGYHYRGPMCESGKGPKPWQQLGDTDIGCLEMHSVKPAEPADDTKIVQDALEFVLKHAESPEEWVFPKYRAGVAGSDSWIAAQETGKADGLGMAYNSEVWSECRKLGVGFLKEAKDRMPGSLSSLLAEAIGHYESVSSSLKEVAALFPFMGRRPEHIADKERRNAAVEHLKKAREAERHGLNTLARVLENI